MADIQATLEQLQKTLYEGKPAPTPERTKASLEDLPAFLAEHPPCGAPQGEPMACKRCGRQLSGGEFRVGYQVGWLCRHCYDLLSLAPLGARCVYCKEVIALDDWRYKLHAVVRENGDLRRYFVHQACEQKGGD